MGAFVISKRSNGEYQFVLKAGNGQTILTSEGYSLKTNAINGIESVRSNSSRLDRYERKTSSNGKYYFLLKASNGQVIGMSEMYESAKSMEMGMDAVRNNAIAATVVDSETPLLPQYAISQFVKERRKQLNLTQEELSLKAGVGLRFIRELEGGDKNTLRIDKVNQVLQLFGYTLGPIPINRNS